MLFTSLGHVFRSFSYICVALTVFILDVVNAVQVAHHTSTYTLADKNAHITLVVLRGVLIIALAVSSLDQTLERLVRSSFMINSILVAHIIYTAVLPFVYFGLRANAVNNHNLRSNMDSIILVQLPLSTYFSGIALSYTLGGLSA